MGRWCNAIHLMNALHNRPKQTRDQRLIEGIVGNAALFRGTSPGQLAAIAKHCWTLEARRSELISARDSRLPGVFALAYGTVKLALRHANGEERVLRLVHAGQSFGESTALLV